MQHNDIISLELLTDRQTTKFVRLISISITIHPNHSHPQAQTRILNHPPPTHSRTALFVLHPRHLVVTNLVVINLVVINLVDLNLIVVNLVVFNQVVLNLLDLNLIVVNH